MELTLMQLDFSVSLNACHDEIMHKMEVLTNMEIQLLRKFEHQLGNSDMHFEMIHDVRVLIVNLQQVYKDVKQYFTEMGIQFVYDFFRKIQVLMVCGYNFMSQALLVNVDKIQDRKNKQLFKAAVPDCKVCKCTCDNSKIKKRQIKEVEHYDYKISMLENEEQKLTSEIQNIYEKMMMQKTMIEKTKPSLAIRQLEDMKQHIQNVMESTNSIFEQTYMMKYVEFKNYLTQIKKPEDIVNYFINNMNYNMKDKFLKAMQRAIYKAQNMEERLQMKHVRDSEAQTDKPPDSGDGRDSIYRGFSSLKPQKNSLLTKERKYNEKMVVELQYVKKQINSMAKQIQTLKSQIQIKQADRKKSDQNYQTLQHLYNKRTLQLDEARSENKWLASEKQNEAKKLRLEIKQLKKQQVETVNEQTQTYISPNCHSVATETEIIYFQNQVDNEIINVLKKANQKMINSLNEKEKKLRQYKISSQEMINLKQCKISCMAFLCDLRQVTEYKMAELNKEKRGIDPDRISTSKKPIIPLNEFTSIRSVNLTIDKLTQDIKKLLLTQPDTNTKINDGRRSSGRRQSRASSRMSSNDRRSSKMSQFSGEKSPMDFFKLVNQRHTSMITAKSDIKTAFGHQQPRKSGLNIEYSAIDEKTKSFSQSSISEENSQDVSENFEFQKKHHNNYHQASPMQKALKFARTQKNQKTEKNEKTQKTLMESEEDDKKIAIKSQIRRGSVFCHKVLSQTITFQVKQQAPKPVYRAVQVQTDILKVQNHEKIIMANNKKHHVPDKKHEQQQNFVLYGEYSQQTDLTKQKLHKFEQNYQAQNQEINKLHAALNDAVKSGYQPSPNRRNQYVVRRPGKLQTQKYYTQMTDRNYVTANSTVPMNDHEVTHNIQENLSKTVNEEHTANCSGFAQNYVFHSTEKSQKSSNNMTLQSRLSALINPTNRNSINQGLIIFKKPNNRYEKRSTQVMRFDEFKIDQIYPKQTQKSDLRTINFNCTTKTEAAFNSSLSPDNKSNWREMINKIEECEVDKQNNSVSSRAPSGKKSKNKPQIKSNFADKYLEDDENLISKRTITRQTTLIDVSKKTPVERERRMSPKSYQPPENAFNRAVKHMLMTTDSRDTLIKKLHCIWQSLEKEKEEKRNKKNTKQIFTSRDATLQKINLSKKKSHIFKLAEILG